MEGGAKEAASLCESGEKRRSAKGREREVNMHALRVRSVVPVFAPFVHEDPIRPLKSREQ